MNEKSSTAVRTTPETDQYYRVFDETVLIIIFTAPLKNLASASQNRRDL